MTPDPISCTIPTSQYVSCMMEEDDTAKKMFPLTVNVDSCNIKIVISYVFEGH